MLAGLVTVPTVDCCYSRLCRVKKSGSRSNASVMLVIIGQNWWWWGRRGGRTVSDEAAVRRPRHVIGIKTLQLRRLDRATSRWLTASAGPVQRRIQTNALGGRSWQARSTDGRDGREDFLVLFCSASHSERHPLCGADLACVTRPGEDDSSTVKYL